jgi:hypothetical protein
MYFNEVWAVNSFSSQSPQPSIIKLSRKAFDLKNENMGTFFPRLE